MDAESKRQVALVFAREILAAMRLVVDGKARTVQFETTYRLAYDVVKLGQGSVLQRVLECSARLLVRTVPPARWTLATRVMRDLVMYHQCTWCRAYRAPELVELVRREGERRVAWAEAVLGGPLLTRLKTRWLDAYYRPGGPAFTRSRAELAGELDEAVHRSKRARAA